MDKVVVLLSTYNGEKYIQDQLKSILNQQGIDVEVIIRDDGSSDGTLSRIREICSNQVTIYEGQNLGYIKSFHWLLKNSPEADYYAFADQDDVWMENKLISGISSLCKDSAEMFCSNAYLTDEQLHPVKMFSDREDNYFNHICKILNSSAQGCTMIFTKKLRDLYKLYDPRYEWPHDYWITTLALFTGRVVYSHKSYLYYRQHIDNVTGGTTGVVTEIKRKSAALKRDTQNPWSRLAEDIFAGYSGMLSTDDYNMVHDLTIYRTNFQAKWRLLINRNFKKEGIVKNIGLKCLLLMNRV